MKMKVKTNPTKRSADKGGLRRPSDYAPPSGFFRSAGFSRPAALAANAVS